MPSGGKSVKSKIFLVFGILAIGAGLFWLIHGAPADEFKGVPVSVTIGIADDMTASLGTIARANQFFLPRELIVTVKDFPSSKQCLEALSRGEVDLATTSETPLVLSAFDRDDLRVITSVGSSENELKIIARADRGIATPSDLRGKRIGIQEDTPPDFFLHLFVLKYGLALNDVDLPQYPPDRLLTALERGEVDAISFREPYITAAKRRLGDRVVVFAEPGFLRITQSVVGLEGYLATHPVVIHKTLVALLEAERYTLEQPEESMGIIARKLRVDSMTIASLWPDFNFHVSLDQSFLIGLQDQAHWILERGERPGSRIPDLFRLISMNGLLAAKPERVSIIH